MSTGNDIKVFALGAAVALGVYGLFSINSSKAHVEADEARNLIKKYDSDNDRKLSTEEGMGLIYGEFDKNKDGYISIKEATKVKEEANRIQGLLGLNRGSESIFQALKEIDRIQQEKGAKK